MLQTTETTLDAWSPPDINWWYRRAQDRVESGPTPVGSKWKIRKCALCSDRAVYVTQHELSQYCGMKPRCVGAETVEVARLLDVQCRYLRWVNSYTTGDDGAAQLVIRVEMSDVTEVTVESPEDPSLPPTEHIPTSEVAEIPRAELEDETQYEVVRVTGNKIGPCQYLVGWTDKSQSWQLVTKLFSATVEVVRYWESSTGHSRARHIASQRLRDGLSTSKEIWRYSDWAKRVSHGVGSVATEVAYVVGVQLTRAGHPTQSSWITQLRKGVFSASALFTVWVIPQHLCTLQGSAVVPLVDVRFSTLQRLVPTTEWKTVSPRLVHHHRALAAGADVPFFWWHSEEQDERWHLRRDGVTDSALLDDVLG